METLLDHPSPCDTHAVHFYADRGAMGPHVAQFILEGLQQQDAVFVVATQETQDETRKHLRATLPQFDALPNYVAVDPDELLSNFLVDAKPDRTHFFEVMDRIFARPLQEGRPIRVYGEMVVRLRHAGLPDAALQLEELWNLLAKRHKFSLLCAYPMSLFEAQDTQWFLHTCAVHSHLSIIADSGSELSVIPT